VYQVGELACENYCQNNFGNGKFPALAIAAANDPASDGVLPRRPAGSTETYQLCLLSHFEKTLYSNFIAQGGTYTQYLAGSPNPLPFTSLVKNAAGYSCPIGSTLSGSMCNKAAGAPTYSCPQAGFPYLKGQLCYDQLSGASLFDWFIPRAEAVVLGGSSPSGYTVKFIPAVAACPSGSVVSGLSCVTQTPATAIPAICK
jgi:hypothetical protein